MTVHVLYFGILKEYSKTGSADISIAEPATVADLLRQLGGQKLPLWKSLAVAVNRDYAGPATPLHDGDEVALLPPVSGGWEARVEG